VQQPQPQRRPVVVFVHGGPEGQTQAALYPVIQYLTHRGYHVLAPNVRGSSGYGKAYLNLDNVEKRLDSVADLAHAAHWLREQPEVDGQRIAVWRGYGGFMVLAAIAPRSCGRRRSTSWASPTSSPSSKTPARTAPSQRASMAAWPATGRGELSPIHGRPHHRAAVVIRPQRPRVPLNRQVAAPRRNVPVLAVYADEGHGLVKLANKLDAFPRVAAFLDDI
jgi:dipeptidyl aminopeptidase/acylaminoacyl peptidase